MGARHLAVLPMPVDVDERRLDIVTTRAIRVGLRRDLDDAQAVNELLCASRFDHAVLSAAVGRVDRALDEEWSRVAARAAALLRAARAQLEG
jgi:hypothetical protein